MSMSKEVVTLRDDGMALELERLARACEVPPTWAALGRLLEMKPNALSQMVRRGNLPWAQMVALCQSRNVSLDAVLGTGKSSHDVMIPSEAPRSHPADGLDVEALAEVVAGVQLALEDKKRKLTAAKFARVVAHLYDDRMQRGGVDAAAFRRFMEVVLTD